METFFNHKNTLTPCTVFIVGNENPIHNVLSVDTGKKEVLFCDEPVKVELGEVVTHVVNFSSISPIYGGYSFPCMFLCFP